MSWFFRNLLTVVLVLAVAFLLWAVFRIAPEIRYNQRSRRINQKIWELETRRPHDISEKMWTECVAWASIAHANICFSERHASYQAMCDFEKQLDEKLKEDVNLSTIKWIGERLAETGPRGQKYMTTTTQWWKQWDGIVEQINQESKP
jgi:hypothetical protein